MQKLSMIVSLAALLFFPSTGSAFAVTTPSFPSCVNPQGSVIASYDTGTHGVPGNTASYTGKDTVYLLTDGNVLQCLCTADGQGIQTNWMKVGQLSDPDIAVLKNNGWIYIPNGALWGLDPVAYLAQNVTYSCQGTSNGGSGSSNNGGGSSNSSSSSSSSSSSTQAVLAAATVLASTGNMLMILSGFSVGILFLLSAFLIKKLSK